MENVAQHFASAWAFSAQHFDNLIADVTQYEPLVEKTLINLPAVQQPLHNASDFVVNNVGLDALTARYLITMMLGYPLSLVFRFLPSRLLKNVFALSVGVILAQFVFGVGWIHAGLSAGVAYLFIVLTSPFKVFKPWRHIVVFFWMMGYMTVSHFYRMRVDYMGWSPDFTGPQMLVTIKVTAFAYNYLDGENAAKYEKEVQTNSKHAKLAKTRLKLAVRSLPNPIEYFAWIYHFGLYFAGPGFELAEYQRALESPSGKDVTNGPGPLFSALKAGLWKFFIALVFIGLNQFSALKFPFTDEIAPHRLAQTSFSEILERIPWMWIALLGVQSKYYFVWQLTEGAANIAGFGFAPKAPDAKSFGIQDWKGVNSVDIFGFLTATNIQRMSRAWNCRTQAWLEHYVFRRSPRGLSMYITYFVSAFWHGFYPGYYLFFMSVPLFASLDKKLRRMLNPLIYVDEDGNPSARSSKPAKGLEVVDKLFHILCVIVTALTTDYLVTAFVSLDWHKGLAIWRSFYFAPHILCVALLILITLMNMAGLKPRVGPLKQVTNAKKHN